MIDDRQNIGDLDAFREEVRRWLDENAPAKPDFKLPDSFLEVSSSEQFDHLRAWQRSVYDAGYLGMSWPSEFGGGGLHRSIKTSSTTRWRHGTTRSC